MAANNNQLYIVLTDYIPPQAARLFKFCYNFIRYNGPGRDSSVGSDSLRVGRAED